MKKSFVIIITCFSLLYAQNQGVGIGTLSPDASARLDVVATDKGILIPRVNLVATNNPAPVASPAVSLLVYNQATINDVVPGFYYWDGIKWVNLSAGVSNDAWLLNGNAGTNSATNFVGTTDAQALTFRTNNIPRFRIANGNQVYGLNGGSASAPFYSWESDANTGMFNPAADELAFSTNGSERVRISSVGNVGIGTTTPAAQLHTTGTVRFANYPSGANGALLRTNNFGDLAITNFTGNANEVLLGNGSFGPVPNNNDWKLDGNTNGVERYIGTNDNLDFPIRTNNTEKMRITTSGNVGIGTTTPTQLLHVSGGSILTNRAYAATTLDLVAAALINITQPATQVRITNVAGAQANAVNYTAAAIEGQYLWITNTDDNDATFAGATIPTNTAMGFVYTGGAWRAVSAPISGGNDWALLGNAGTNSATNFVGTTDAQALTFRTNNIPRFRIANGNQVYALANGTANAPFYSWENDADMGLFRASVDELGFSTAGAERMRIAANGNVGIGTSTPDASAILDASSSNKGILAPRVNLVAANNPAPVTSPATGLLVFNTATSGTYPNDVFPGYYYWDGTRWVRQVSQNISVWYYPPTNINANTRYTLTGTLPGVSPTDGVCVNLLGDWGIVPQVVIEHVEARTNEVRFVVYNRSLLTNYIGMDFVITIIKP